ncbi:MAG: LCP family protein [Clostridia bacterium]|nr:LCP family protein [Clostridia bacterium]
MSDGRKEIKKERGELKRSLTICIILLLLLVCTPAFLAVNEVISMTYGLGGSGEYFTMTPEEAEKYRLMDADQSLTDSEESVIEDADAQAQAFLQEHQEVINADESGIINILLIGCDSHDYEDYLRSDSMIILSIDRERGEVKLTSLMRDMRVYIEGYGYDKLNAAFAYDGSGKLLLDTIESNFLIRIEDFICINYRHFRDAIDLLGGVEVDVDEDYIDAINACIGEEKHHLTEGGVQRLNGAQTLGFCQMRKVGNDTGRTERQRIVMSKLLAMASELSLLEMREVIETMMPGLLTNMSQGELFYLALQAVTMGEFETQQMRIPLDGTWYDLIKNKIWYIGFDHDANVEALHDFIYGCDDVSESDAA